MYDADNTGHSENMSMLQGHFKLNENSILELQHRCEVTRVNNGLGISESYCDYGTFGLLKFWKLGE